VSRGAETEHVRLRVSIGVAALGARWEADTANPLTDMLAAAGAALNLAKQNGRNQVCVVTKNVTSGPGADSPLARTAE
jgi:GGDEF domain-containing protein